MNELMSLYLCDGKKYFYPENTKHTVLLFSILLNVCAFLFSPINSFVSLFEESGGLWQPDPAASHAGTSAKTPTLRDAAQRLPQEAARGRPRL